MNTNVPTIILRRDWSAQVWTATFRCPQDGRLITAPTPFFADCSAGVVVRNVQRSSPRLRVGVIATDIGPDTAVAALNAGHVVDGEPVLWFKHPQDA